jgi:hypothetical protein
MRTASACDNVTARCETAMITSQWTELMRLKATYRKVTDGFRSNWGADLFAAVRSVVGMAAQQGRDAYQPIRAVLDGETVVQPG